jgi:hypothetical protein
MRKQAICFAVCCGLLSWGSASALGTARRFALTQADVVDATPPIPTVPVFVTNLPAVQTVEGNIAVTNLPDVQNVAGTVNVGNLPFADDGTLKVTSAPPPARQMVWYELLDAPADLCAGMPTQRSVNTDGYALIGARVVVPGDPTVGFELAWQFADDEPFVPLADIRNGLWTSGSAEGTPQSCRGISSNRLLCRNVGGNVQVQFGGYSGCPKIVTSIRIYLVP